MYDKHGTNLKAVGVEVDGVCEVDLSGLDHGDYAGETKDFIVVTIVIPASTKILVSKSFSFVLHCQIVDDLKWENVRLVLT